MELLCQEIESSTGIQLKKVSFWLLNKSQLEKCLKAGTRRRSAIVITVGTSKKVAKLCFKGLRFRRALKVVEKYWKAGPDSVYLSCAGVKNYCLGKYKDKTVECVICADAHKVENH